MNKQPGWVRDALGPLRRTPQVVEPLFWLSPPAMALWLLDYRYGALFVRMETERLWTVARISFKSDFAQSWPIEAALSLVGDSLPELPNRRDIARLLAKHHDALAAQLGSDIGRANLQRVRPEHDALHAEGMAQLRTPAEVERLTTAGIAASEQERRTYWFGVLEPLATKLVLIGLAVLTAIVFAGIAAVRLVGGWLSP